MEDFDFLCIETEEWDASVKKEIWNQLEIFSVEELHEMQDKIKCLLFEKKHSVVSFLQENGVVLTLEDLENIKKLVLIDYKQNFTPNEDNTLVVLDWKLNEENLQAIFSLDTFQYPSSSGLQLEIRYKGKHFISTRPNLEILFMIIHDLKMNIDIISLIYLLFPFMTKHPDQYELLFSQLEDEE